MFVPTRALLEGILDFIRVTQAGMDESIVFGARLGLIKAAITPDRETLLAALTPADFDGYNTTGALTWGPVFDSLGDLISMRLPSQHYQPTGSVTPNTIYGAYLLNAAEDTLLGVEIFDAPIPLAGPDDGFDYQLTFSFDHLGNWGLGLVG